MPRLSVDIDLEQDKADTTSYAETSEHFDLDVSRKRVKGFLNELLMLEIKEKEFLERFKIKEYMPELKKRRMSVLAPDKNVYLKIYVLWPEMLFVTGVPGFGA